MLPRRNTYRNKYFSTFLLEEFTLNIASEKQYGKLCLKEAETIPWVTLHVDHIGKYQFILKGGGKKFQILPKGDEKKYKMTMKSGKSVYYKQSL